MTSLDFLQVHLSVTSYPSHRSTTCYLIQGNKISFADTGKKIFKYYTTPGHATPKSLFNKQDSSYYHAFKCRVENSVDPDQFDSQKPADMYVTFSEHGISLVQHGKGKCVECSSNYLPY